MSKFDSKNMRKLRCPHSISSLYKGSPAHYCYFFLIFWIIIFTTGLYWLLTEAGSKTSSVVQSSSGHKEDLEELYANNALEIDDYAGAAVEDDLGQVATKSGVAVEVEVVGQKPPLDVTPIERLCNRRELIKAKDEHFHHPDFKLEALMILFRHGDRGPLTHLGHRNISHINCQDTHPEYLDLIRFVGDMGKMTDYSKFIGPFHSFPRIPSGNGCSLGQLSTKGVIQLLTLGKLVREAYESSGLFGNGSIAGVKVKAYSTRYRRTFQSLLAFLYGLLGPQGVIPSVTITESQSTAFCFNHCSCKVVDRLTKEAIARSQLPSRQDKQDMADLVSELNTILELGKVKKTGASLLDSLLVYSCHQSPLPCRRRRQWKVKTRDCITPEKLQRLIDLIEIENQGMKETNEQHRHALLSSYGLIKEILNLALHMTSSGPVVGRPGEQEQIRSRLAIFSGHDKTLQGLLGALGIVNGHPDLNLLPYASRFVIEIYRKLTLPENSARKHFLRFIYNGQAITQLIDFCRDSFVTNDKSGQAIELCPMESLVRFFHDSYFDPFPKEVVNFKDACHL